MAAPCTHPQGRQSGQSCLIHWLICDDCGEYTRLLTVLTPQALEFIEASLINPAPPV